MCAVRIRHIMQNLGETAGRHLEAEEEAPTVFAMPFLRQSHVAKLDQSL